MLSLKKRLCKTKTMKHYKLYFKLFPCFYFRLLWLWFVFLDSVSVLRFNFVIFCVCCRFVMLIFVLGFVFLFSGSVFPFWVSHFVLCVSLWVCSFLFLLLLLSCGFFVSIGHPIYLIVLCI